MHTNETLLPDTASIGTVDLLVRDADRVVPFYAEGAGLERLGEDGNTFTLGSAGKPLLRLIERRDLPEFSARDAGLFHTAFLYPNRADLAEALARTAQIRGGRYAGSADHLVSEAFYFSDPEGNGVELYTDRPREKWTFNRGGQVEMASLPLDPNRFLSENLAPGELRSGNVTVGHVHLQVGSIPVAKEFYGTSLGMPITARMGNSALFLASGGYHHHLGLNTWNSAGAGPRAASLGLANVTIQVPTTSDLDKLTDRLTNAGIPAKRRSDADRAGSELLFRDPWGTEIQVVAEA